MKTGQLSTLLFKERELLELLHFKLEEQHLLLVAGKTQWISLGTREIEKVLDKVHAAGLERSLAAEQLAESLGLQPQAPLTQIISALPEGTWKDIFTSHLAALQEVTTHIGRLRDENQRFLSAAHRSTQETLANLGEDPSLYGPGGAPAGGQSAAHIIDTNL